MKAADVVDGLRSGQPVLAQSAPPDGVALS